MSHRSHRVCDEWWVAHLIQLLLDALHSGDVTIRAGEIIGRCGYTDWVNRTVVLNPEAPPEQLEAQLAHALELLTPIPEQRHDEPDRPRLQLVPGCDDEGDESWYCPERADASGE